MGRVTKKANNDTEEKGREADRQLCCKWWVGNEVGVAWFIYKKGR